MITMCEDNSISLVIKYDNLRNMNKDELLIAIGKNIKKIRESKNISQAELAAKCNYEKSNMSRIESGKTNMTIGTLLTISNALDVSLITLISFNNTI